MGRLLNRTFVRLAVAGVMAATVAACGGSASHRGGSSTTTTTIDAHTVEAAIARSAQGQRHRTPSVTCPAGIPLRAGERFYCVAELGKSNTPFRVTETNGKGAVTYKGLSAGAVPLLDTSQVAQSITRSIARQRKLTATVACPAPIPRQRGLDFVCTAMVKGKATTNFVVTQKNSQGSVSYRAG